jgi:FAD/FMN-containing dehydrogenase
MRITNFGGNLTFEPQTYFAPKSEQEVLEILASCKGRRIRVIGRLHSWSEAPQGDDVLMDLKHLNEVRMEEREGVTWATIQGGCQVKRAIAELDQAGVTLPSLGLITEQSIAGAAATGTHGSGKNSMAHYVDEATIATYDTETGEPTIRTVSSGPELLAVRCSLGCLGVILSVGIRCRAQYYVEEHLRIYSDTSELLAAEEQYPLQQFLLVPHFWKIIAQHRRVVDRRRSLLAPLYRIYWLVAVDFGLHLILLAMVRWLRSRPLVRFFYRRVLPIALLRGFKVVDKSQHILTMEHELFRHIEIEVFVRRSKVCDALEYVRQLLDYTDGKESCIAESTWQRLEESDRADSVRQTKGIYTHHYPICVRKILPDETFISMASSVDEPYYSISFVNYNRPSERESFLKFANILAQTTADLFQARPHWGKFCPIDAQTARQLYPRLNEFRDICNTADPNGVFRNPWIDTVIFDTDRSMS